MKFLFVADIHFMNKDLEQKVHAFHEMMAFAKKNGYTHIIIAGDVYDTRSAVSTKVKMVVEELFAKYGIDFEFFVLAGNHDMPQYNLPEVNSLNSFKYIEGVRVFDTSGWTVIDGTKIGFIPYCNDLDRFKLEFKDLAQHGLEIIVIHQGVDEAKSAGVPDCGLNVNFFSSCFEGKIVAGDYHKAHQVGNFLSPGCLIQDDFNDAGMDKGFWTFDLGVFTFVKADYPEFVKLAVESMSEVKGVKFTGKHMWFVTTDPKMKKKLTERCLKDEAASCKVTVTKEFATSHPKVIEIAAPSEMFANCIKIREPANAQLQEDLFNRICVKKETYADTQATDFDINSFLKAVDVFHEESLKSAGDIVVGDPIAIGGPPGSGCGASDVSNKFTPDMKEGW